MASLMPRIKCIWRELTAFALQLVIVVLWILGMTGKLGRLPDFMVKIQQWSGLMNSVFAVLNVVILVIIACCAKKSIDTERHPEYKRLTRNIVEVYKAVEDRNENIEQWLVQERKHRDVQFQQLQQTQRHLVDCLNRREHKEMLKILSNQPPPQPVVVKSIEHRQRLFSGDVIKMAVAGSSRSGKTSLLNRWRNESESLGLKVEMKIVNTSIGSAPLEVSDIPGDSPSLTNSGQAFAYDPSHRIQNFSCVVIVVDGTSEKSLDTGIWWYKQARVDCFVVCIVNKIDLPNQMNREILRNRLHEIPWYEVSAVTGYNVDHVFSLIALGAVLVDCKQQITA